MEGGGRFLSRSCLTANEMKATTTATLLRLSMRMVELMVEPHKLDRNGHEVVIEVVEVFVVQD